MRGRERGKGSVGGMKRGGGRDGLKRVREEGTKEGRK